MKKYTHPLKSKYSSAIGNTVKYFGSINNDVKLIYDQYDGIEIVYEKFKSYIDPNLNEDQKIYVVGHVFVIAKIKEYYYQFTIDSYNYSEDDRWYFMWGPDSINSLYNSLKKSNKEHVIKEIKMSKPINKKSKTVKKIKNKNDSKQILKDDLIPLTKEEKDLFWKNIVVNLAKDGNMKYILKLFNGDFDYTHYGSCVKNFVLWAEELKERCNEAEKELEEVKNENIDLKNKMELLSQDSPQ